MEVGRGRGGGGGEEFYLFSLTVSCQYDFFGLVHEYLLACTNNFWTSPANP